MSSDTRHTILRATRELLEERAWSDMGLAEVGKRAGVSRQAVYLHFGSRSQLLLALVEYVDDVEGLAALAGRVRVAGSGPEALDRLAWLNAEYEPRIHSVVVAHDAERRTDPDLEAAWRDRMQARRRLYAHVAERLEDEGVLSVEVSRQGAVDLMYALLSPRVHEELTVERGWSRRRYEAQLRRLLRGALLA